MDPKEAYSIVQEHTVSNFGRFYGDFTQLDLGAGVIYSGIRIPIYDEDSALFGTYEGKVYVITHECDTSQDNKRPFNNDVIVCPIIPMESLIAEYIKIFPEASLRDFLIAIARRTVFRVVFLPAFSPDLEYGGFLVANRLVSTKVSAFQREGATKINAVSRFGLDEVDRSFQNVLFRPKDQALTFAPR